VQRERAPHYIHISSFGFVGDAGAHGMSLSFIKAQVSVCRSQKGSIVLWLVSGL
jgi:hypothetical protein